MGRRANHVGKAITVKDDVLSNLFIPAIIDEQTIPVKGGIRLTALGETPDSKIKVGTVVVPAGHQYPVL